MKAKFKKIIMVVLVLMIISVNITPQIYAEIFYGIQQFASKYFGQTEEQVYVQKLNDTKESLIEEISALGKNMGNEDMIALLPLAQALRAKKEEFTEEEILTLLKKFDENAAMAELLVTIYRDKDADFQKLYPLLKNDSLSDKAKQEIVAAANFTPQQFEEICRQYDDSTAVFAMQKLMIQDANQAYVLALEILADKKQISDTKLKMAALAISEYFDTHKGESAEKRVIAEKLKSFQSSASELVKDQLIYAMANLKDFDVFTYIINSNEIDKDLKITAIQQNLNVMLEKIDGSFSTEELNLILTAMQIHPIFEIGDALAAALEKNQVPKEKEKEVEEVIRFIKEK